MHVANSEEFKGTEKQQLHPFPSPIHGDVAIPDIVSWKIHVFLYV